MGSPLYYFKFNVKDWLADSKVRAMTPAQRGAYVDLLCFQWEDGSIPADTRQLARMVGVPHADFVRSYWPAILPRFDKVTEAGREVMKNQRLEAERTQARAISVTKAGNRSKPAKPHEHRSTDVPGSSGHPLPQDGSSVEHPGGIVDSRESIEEKKPAARAGAHDPGTPPPPPVPPGAAAAPPPSPRTTAAPKPPSTAGIIARAFESVTQAPCVVQASDPIVPLIERAAGLRGVAVTEFAPKVVKAAAELYADMRERGVHHGTVTPQSLASDPKGTGKYFAEACEISDGKRQARIDRQPPAKGASPVRSEYPPFTPLPPRMPAPPPPPEIARKLGIKTEGAA